MDLVWTFVPEVNLVLNLKGVGFERIWMDLNLNVCLRTPILLSLVRIINKISKLVSQQWR